MFSDLVSLKSCARFFRFNAENIYNLDISNHFFKDYKYLHCLIDISEIIDNLHRYEFSVNGQLNFENLFEKVINFI